MKIAYLTWVFPALSQTFVDNQVLSLQKQDQDLVLLNMRDGHDITQNASAISLENVRIRFPGFFSIYSWRNILSLLFNDPKILTITIKYLFPWVKWPVEFFKLICLLPRTYYFAKICKDKSIEHIHCDFLSLHLVTAQIIAEFLKIATSARVHTAIDGGNKARLLLLLRNIDFVIANAEHTKKALAIRLNKDIPIIVIPQAVNIEKFRDVPDLNPSSNLIAAVGRLHPLKGFIYLIEAINILQNKGIEIECVIVGGGEQRKELETLVEKYHLEKLIIFTGAVPQERIVEILEKSFAIVVSSISEGLPTVIIEAMAAGRPVISTSVGAISEIVHDGQNGFLFPKRDSEALAATIESLISDPSTMLKLGSQAREYINLNYDLEKNTKVFIDYLRDRYVLW